MVKNSLQGFDAEETCIHPRNRSVSFQSVAIVFIIFERSHDAVLKMCMLELRFQIYRFRNLPAKDVPFSCEREANPSHVSPFSKCAGIV